MDKRWIVFLCVFFAVEVFADSAVPACETPTADLVGKSYIALEKSSTEEWLSVDGIKFEEKTAFFRLMGEKGKTTEVEVPTYTCLRDGIPFIVVKVDSEPVYESYPYVATGDFLILGDEILESSFEDLTDKLLVEKLRENSRIFKRAH